MKLLVVRSILLPPWKIEKLPMVSRPIFHNNDNSEILYCKPHSTSILSFLTMDILGVLESMAGNVSSESDSTVSATDKARWQRLFGFSEAEATRQIQDYRSDYARARISDEIWATVQPSKEAEGFDREAYEYLLAHRQALPITARPPPRDTSGTFIVHLTGPLSSAEVIKEAAALSSLPEIFTGTDESGISASFCEIDGEARANLLEWKSQHPGFDPTIVRLAKAKKDLCAYTLAPMLGVDATLPQHRLNDDSISPLPSQNQHPVWYFFYGTLCNFEILARHVEMEDTVPQLFVPAYVKGGRVRTWAGKYKALVDSYDSESRVHGMAFLVLDREQEDALRFYETDKYEVVRCQIFIGTGVAFGLTFRFCGAVKELD